MSRNILLILYVLFIFGQPSYAGIGALIGGYGLCQTGCNAAWVACCTTAGVVAGTATAGAGAPVAVLACNTLQGICMASCAASFLVAPTP